MAEIELNTKIFRKDNLDIVYSITGKKYLNGILHYKLKSESSEEIFLSEHAVNDRFVTESNYRSRHSSRYATTYTALLSGVATSLALGS